LRRANLRLEVVRHLWRLAHELKAIAIRQYEHGAKLIDVNNLAANDLSKLERLQPAKPFNSFDSTLDANNYVIKY
jgi:hypothetical protein